MAMRKGMWVMVQDGTKSEVGILVEPGFTQSEVHFVDAKGETTKMRKVPTGRIRPAELDDIPEPRRPKTR